VDDTSPVASQANVLPFLSACASIAPTFLSLGNHEWMVDQEDLDMIRSTGVTVLDNNWRPITVDGKEIILAGLTSGYVTDYRAFRAESGSPNRYPRQESISGIGGAVHARYHKPETEWLPAFAGQAGYHILLSHHPEYFPLIPDSIDLILSGHAHGGQWRIFGHGVWSPGQGWWPRWTRGVYCGRLVVSAGLSNTTWIPRIENPTEIVYLEP
jgi:predicted MPP superfamily phosphohydrolase